MIFWKKKKRFVVRDSYDSVVIWDTKLNKEFVEVANCHSGNIPRVGLNEAYKKAKEIVRWMP